MLARSTLMRNPWTVLALLVFVACAVAAWGVVGELAMWQPPRVGVGP